MLLKAECMLTLESRGGRGSLLFPVAGGGGSPGKRCVRNGVTDNLFPMNRGRQ